MTTTVWRGFQDSLDRILEEHGGAIITRVTGVSTWNGGTEETYLVLVSLPEPAAAGSQYGDSVADRLADLARAYRQDAIGLVGGPGESIVEASI